MSKQKKVNPETSEKLTTFVKDLKAKENKNVKKFAVIMQARIRVSRRTP